MSLQKLEDNEIQKVADEADAQLDAFFWHQRAMNKNGTKKILIY